METNFNDLFNLSSDSFVTPLSKGKFEEVYKPTADKGKDGVYKALIRFVPWYKNPNGGSKRKKYYLWCEDPISNESFAVDCPSSVGKPSPIKNAFWAFKKSTSAKEQEYAKYFSRGEVYSAVIQIVKDDHQPELEGKLMVYQFKVKINDKIEAELKPEFGVAPCNPFDLFEGRMFALHITKKAGYNNYDNCKFIGEKTPILIDGKQLTKTQDDMSKVFEFLKTNSPDLDKYEYKEWTPESETKFANYVKNVIPDNRLVSQILAGINTGASVEYPSTSTSTNEPAVTRPSSVSEPTFDIPAQTPVAQKTETRSANNPSSLDDLYASL
jgi:hypothetical protein